MNCICTNVEAGLLYPKGILDLHIAALAAPEATQLPLARRVTSIEPGHPQLLPLNGYSCQALSQLMPSREIFGPPNLGVKLKIKREQHFKRISLLILGFWSLTAWKPSLVKRTRYKRPKYQNDHSSKKVHEPSPFFYRAGDHDIWGGGHPVERTPNRLTTSINSAFVSKNISMGAQDWNVKKNQGEQFFKYKVPFKSGNCSSILPKIC